MTLTELKYVIAVARMRHFGRAAESCFVSQPSLSVAIRKLEDELGVTIFERRTSDISITPIGQQIVEQAQRVLDESRRIIDIAQSGHDPLASPMRLGVILTIAPYLLPNLLTELSDSCNQMPLYLEESFTDELLVKLRSGTIDAAIMADTIHGTGLMTQTLYQEEFVVAVPAHHPWVNRNFVNADELKDQTMLLLGSGHCFRDQILGICPDLNRHSKSDRSEVQHTVEGSSLLTICHMVAQGLGITVLPSSAVPYLTGPASRLKILPFKQPAPSRRVILVWRKSYTRKAAIEAIAENVRKVVLNGCVPIFEPPELN